MLRWITLSLAVTACGCGDVLHVVELEIDVQVDQEGIESELYFSEGNSLRRDGNLRFLSCDKSTPSGLLARRYSGNGTFKVFTGDTPPSTTSEPSYIEAFDSAEMVIESAYGDDPLGVVDRDGVFRPEIKSLACRQGFECIDEFGRGAPEIATNEVLSNGDVRISYARGDLAVVEVVHLASVADESVDVLGAGSIECLLHGG